MTSTMAPICMMCAHFRREAPGLTCDAYPDGIPEKIIENEVDHRTPYAGDHGIQYEPDPSFATDMVARFLEYHDAIWQKEAQQ